MIELNSQEISEVGGAGLRGMLWGAVDGAATGALIASKHAGSGGFIAGAIAQGVGTAWGMIQGGFTGAALGLFTDSATVSGYWKHYRETLGAAPSAPHRGSL